MKLAFRVDAKEVQNAVGDLRRKVAKPRPMLKDIGQIIADDIRFRIISSKADSKERAWAPWMPSTAKARAKKGNAALGLLYDTGTLLDSITSQIVGSHNTVQVGTNVHYAKYLNDGTEKMAAREFMGISDAAKHAIDEAVHQYFGTSRKT